MKPAVRIGVCLVAALPSVAAAAGKYSWFDDGSMGPSASAARSSLFDVDVYRSSADATDDAGVSSDHAVSVYGDYSPRVGEDRFTRFGLRWQHRVSSQDSLSVMAQQADSSMLHPAITVGTDSIDKRAQVSWTRELSWAWKPSITGGVFVGDEAARSDDYRRFGRRYYGFSVGGELRLLQAHTPYVSFRMERSLYDAPDSGSSTTFIPRDDSSRVAAGWRWQVQRGWSVQAEASYGVNGYNNPDLLPRDRGRVFFGTRFDFK